ncbi:MAG: hypothetical protein U1E50_17140 [Caulobacteraceae bacterium]
MSMDNDTATSGGRRKANGEAKVEAVADDIEAKVDDAAEKAQEAINRLTEKATAAIGEISRRGQEAYDQAAERVKDLNEKVRPMVVEKPYPALAVALGAGFVLGALLMGRGPKVIYVKPRM